MIQVDLSQATPFLNAKALDHAKERALSGFKQVKNAAGEGAEWLGWRRILAEPNDAELEQIDHLAGVLRDEIDVLVVCGIGGSYLGARALLEALIPAFGSDKGPELIFAGHHMGGTYLDGLLKKLETPRADGTPKQVAVNVISKSGGTLETMLAFRVLRKWMHRQFPDKASQRIFCTTSKKGGMLNPLAEQYGYRRFVIPDDVGGRFSVLTPVGLFPAAVAGIDIRILFYDAVAKYKQLDEQPEDLLNYAAVRYALSQEGKQIDLITSFEPSLFSLGRWLQQLFGESEGKQGKGFFPAVSTYSADLHSLGQFVQQGPRNMIETFIAVEKAQSNLSVEKEENDLDGLNYLEGESFHSINQKALDGTRRAHVEGGVPCVTITLPACNEQHLGEFIYFFELFTAVYCYMLEVNPFIQPGVEAYKKEVYTLLGR